MQLAPSSRWAFRKAFSLVEVTLALGVFAFAVIGIIGLISIALDTATSTQRETAVSAMIGHLDARVRSATTPAAIAALTASPLYFDQVGKPLTNDAGATYEVSLAHTNQSAASKAQLAALLGLQNADKLYFWKAQVQDPYPANKQTTRVLLSSLLP